MTMITGWATSTRLNPIIVHYYSEEDGRPICKTKLHRRGPATIPKPGWNPEHPLTCKRCRQLVKLITPPDTVSEVS